MFKKAHYNRISDNVINQIEEAIIARRLNPGDRLPSERELQEMLGISRGSLRESLRVLEQKSLIEIKSGIKGGIFVKGVSTEQVSDSLSLLIRFRKISLKELAQFRLDIEGIIASRAAQQATSEDIQDLKNLIYEAEAILDAEEYDWKAFISVDRQFHMALGRIARNQIHESVLMTVHNNIERYYESFLPRDRDVSRQAFRGLEEILKAVEAGQADKAFTLAQNHVLQGNKYMEERAVEEAGEA
jgi:DNA-binding FadR family transcriptional regulator